MKIKKRIFTLILLIVFGPSGFFFLRGLPSKMMTSKIPFLYYTACSIQNFAIEHNTLFFPEKYKSEIEDFIYEKVPEIEENMDKIMLELNENYENFVNSKNSEQYLSEFLYKIDDFERALDDEQYILYTFLSNITDKYLLLEIGNVPTDWAESIYANIEPYFEKGKVNTINLKHLNDYLQQKKELLYEYREKVEHMTSGRNSYRDDSKMRAKLINKAILRWSKYKGKRMPIAYC